VEKAVISCAIACLPYDVLFHNLHYGRWKESGFPAIHQAGNLKRVLVADTVY
jgi:hypothetical protein